MPEEVAARVFELPEFHRRRALLALSLLSSRPFLAAVLRGQRIPLLRLLFNSVRRLILHTHYGRPAARALIGHAGPLHMREPKYAWEGAIAGALPVVAATNRNPDVERIVPVGVIENITSDTEIRTQYCVIGSGVGGAMAAAILAQAGHDVVVMEEGGYYSSADFSDDENKALSTLYADAGLRSTDEMNVSILQGRCAGGGSTVNWMVMLRTPDHVLDEWRREHGFDFSDADMRGAFERFEQENGVGPVADHAHSPMNRLILDGCARLGWSAHGASINARECMRSGACGLGCKYNAKQGTTNTYLPRALAAGARLYCNARVERIGTGHVHARTSNGTLHVTCDRIIVAAGAVGTPVLLQRSGLGSSEVGRHLRLHPTTAVVGIYDRPFYAAGGIPLTTYCDEFTQLRNGYGHWIEAPPLSAGLAAVALPGYGEAHRAYMQQFPYLAPLIVLVRDGEPSGPSVGVVRARGTGVTIRYSLGASDRAAMNHGLQCAERIHQEMGAKKVLTLHPTEARVGDPALFSAHVNGTCRIGADARRSACTPDGALRGHPGVYVMDGSLLPTAPGVNPHETIAALIMLLAENLKQH